MNKVLEFNIGELGFEAEAIDSRYQAVAVILSELNTSEVASYIFNDLTSVPLETLSYVLSDQIDRWKVEFQSNECSLIEYDWDDSGEPYIKEQHKLKSAEVIELIDSWKEWINQQELKGSGSVK